MDLNLTPQERQFRDELRAWIAEHAPRDWEQRSASQTLEERFAYLRDWQRQVYEAGWAGLSWPGPASTRPTRGPFTCGRTIT